MMIRLAVLFILLWLASCVSTQRAEPIVEEPPQCPIGEFRGAGVDETAALSDLAKQINSSIKVTTERVAIQQRYNENENLSIIYKDATFMESDLSNAQDARIIYNRGGKAVACMNKADAAKGFLERQRLAADSLDMLSILLRNAERPKQKNEAWRKTQMLWNKFAGIQSLLDGWGVESKYSGLASDAYSKARDDYKDYCKSVKVHWEAPEGECSDAAFAMLSKNTVIEKSECSGGIRLRFACAEKCKSVSFGVECSFEPSLAIESCGGERYSLLRAREPVAGSDMHSKNRAMENLLGNLRDADFFNEWEKEVEEWVPKCVE